LWIEDIHRHRAASDLPGPARCLPISGNRHVIPVAFWVNSHSDKWTHAARWASRTKACNSFCSGSRIGETLSTQPDGCEYGEASPVALDALTRCDRCLFGTAVPEI
jgi:hypothetical protein